ncbi:MAG: hypothetical protein HYV40_06170 [Candidatus Levybacteria bacterium]|nr:hypothetical protein [Candidatus Levybacteria bacterium]
MPIVPKDFQLSLLKKEQVAKDTWTFYFDRTAVSDFDFLSGQYVRMTLDVIQPDERGTGRFFSISSSPLNKQYLTITTRILQSAFKKTLFDLAPGTPVKFFGPVGRFIFNDEETMPHIFLAGGIGITPSHSMLLYAAEKNLSFPITLFVSFSTVEDVVFYDELMKISADHPSIKVVYTITKPEADSSASSSWSKIQDQLDSGVPASWRVPRMTTKWTRETGRINADLIKKYCPDFLSSQYYISGPPAMVDAMLAIVNEMGVPGEQVKKEKFVGY